MGDGMRIGGLGGDPSAALQALASERLQAEERAGEIAGEGFEQLLLQRMIKAMRATVPKTGFLDSDHQTQLFDHLVETSLAGHMASHGGIGVQRLFRPSPSAHSVGPLEASAPGAPVDPTFRMTRMTPMTGATVVARSGEAPSAIEPARAEVPLARQLPPDADAWLESPQAEAILRAKLNKID